jgi:hypothetical protein
MKYPLYVLILILSGCDQNTPSNQKPCASEWDALQINLAKSFEKDVLCPGLDTQTCGCNTNAVVGLGGVRSIKEWTCPDKRILEESLPGAGIFIVREVVYPLTFDNNKGLPSKVVGDIELASCYDAKVNYTGCTLTDVRLYCVK